MRAADRYVAQNRRARHDYLIEDTLEAGVVLQGTEVKVLRQGQASIAEAYADEEAGELYLVNANIPEYPASAHFNHQPRRIAPSSRFICLRCNSSLRGRRG